MRMVGAMRMTDKLMRRIKVVTVIVLFISVRSLLFVEKKRVGAARVKKRVPVNVVSGPR